VYQRPDWEVAWDDQVGYQRLGHVLATTGTFTPSGVEPFVPRNDRTPVSVVRGDDLQIAGESHAAVAVGQAVLFALMALVVCAMTAPGDEPLPRRAWLTRLLAHSMLGALVLSDLVCAFFVTLGMDGGARH
jgi:hypothetical protein